MPDAPVPAYYRIKQALLDEIQRGEYVAGRAFITERAICERFGVSRITAVRALNELVQEGVLNRQRGRGTFVGSATQTLTRESSPTRLVAGIFNHLQGQHVMSIIRGIEHTCRELNYQLMLFDSAGSAETEAHNLDRALSAQAQGIVAFPVNSIANVVNYADTRSKIPVVLVDRYFPDLSIDAVVPDNFNAGLALTTRLIADGHRHIAFISDGTASTAVQDRHTGYRQAFREHQLPLIPALAVLRSYSAQPEAQRRDLLAQWLAAPYRPTAFLAVNSYVLMSVVNDLLQLQIDLSTITLASLDHANLDDLLARAAAVIELPAYALGTHAMQLLGKRLDGDSSPDQHVVLPIELATPPSMHLSLRLPATDAV